MREAESDFHVRIQDDAQGDLAGGLVGLDGQMTIDKAVRRQACCLGYSFTWE